jgi:hypothetical protein
VQGLLASLRRRLPEVATHVQQFVQYLREKTAANEANDRDTEDLEARMQFLPKVYALRLSLPMLSTQVVSTNAFLGTRHQRSKISYSETLARRREKVCFHHLSASGGEI